MTGSIVKTFARSAGRLAGYAAAFKAATDDEVIVVAANRRALGRTCKVLGFHNLNLSQVKQVSISDPNTPPVESLITPILEQVKNAHSDAVEAARRPSSKQYREAVRTFQKHVDTLATTAKVLESAVANRWTPVSEKLPDDDTLVLVALNDDDVWTGFRDAGVWKYVDAMPIAKERVTHWMPLPAAPVKGAA